MEFYVTFITLGSLFIVGLITDEIGRRIWLPRVTLLILLGVLSGPAFFDILPMQMDSLYEPLATIALTMVAFLLGGSLSRKALSSHGPRILIISLAVVTTTLVIVSGGLIAMGVAPELALLFSAIATATAPAAIQDVIKQTGAKGEFTQTLQGIVAVDDAWGLIVFSLMLIVANAMLGNGFESLLQKGLWELGGAIVIGVGIGVPAAFVTGRLRPGEPIQIEALAVVFLCAGVSIWLHVSFLLAGIVAGMIVVNFATHHTRPFHEIENIEWPFVLLFFFLAGAMLRGGFSSDLGLLIIAFVILRIVSRFAGAWIGGTLAKATGTYRRWMGVALLPQAGVVVGMALIAANRFPEFAETILSVTISATIVFEILGPIGTLIALKKVGEIDPSTQE